MSVIMSLVVILKFLWERGQAKCSIKPVYCPKGMLFWKKGSAFVLTGKVQ